LIYEFNTRNFGVKITPLAIAPLTPVFFQTIQFVNQLKVGVYHALMALLFIKI